MSAAPGGAGNNYETMRTIELGHVLEELVGEGQDPGWSLVFELAQRALSSERHRLTSRYQDFSAVQLARLVEESQAQQAAVDSEVASELVRRVLANERWPSVSATGEPGLSGAGHRRIFLSVTMEDYDLAVLFREQLAPECGGLEFVDCALKAPVDGAEAPATKARVTRALEGSALVICLIGGATAGSSWIDWELRKAQELGKEVLGVRLHPVGTADENPTVLAHKGAKVISWYLEEIRRQLEGQFGS